MKPRRRSTTAIKWTGAVTTLLLLIIWIGSAWYSYRLCVSPSTLVAVEGGRIYAVSGYGTALEPRAWSFSRLDIGLYWWMNWSTMPPWKFLAIPIWSLALLTGIPTFLMWRHDRRVQRADHVCSNCGYSRTGLPADRACPECGNSRTDR